MGDLGGVGGSGVGVELAYYCPEGGTSALNGYLDFRNPTTENAQVFVDNGLADPLYYLLQPSSSAGVESNPGRERLTIQVQDSAGIATFDVLSRHRNATNDCWVQGQAFRIMP